MKKLTILTLILCFAFMGKAQYITIPDANFKAFLQGKYPTAFNGSGQMDTTNSLIVNEDTLNCSYQTINNITGLQYFKKLEYLDCSGNPFTMLSALSENLRDLLCTNSNVTTLPSLPDSLKYLAVSGNNLTSIPTLPKNLLNLICSGSPNLKCLPFINYNTFVLTDLSYLPNYINPMFLCTLGYKVATSKNNPNNCNITNGRFINMSDRLFSNAISAVYPNLVNEFQQLDTIEAAKTTYLDFYSMTYQECDSPYTGGYHDVNIDLSDLKYFKNLKSLSIYDTKLLGDFSVYLTDSLEYLDISLVEISNRKFSHIPLNLKHFYFESTNIDSLPTLPSSLITLSMASLNWNNNQKIWKSWNDPSYPYGQSFPLSHNTKLKNLPALPSGLENLHIDAENLDSIPNVLPSGLKSLAIRSKKISNMPVLPNGITEIGLMKMPLQCLPKLPDSLRYLSIDSSASNIKCLSNIPANLKIYNNTNGINNHISYSICSSSYNPNNCPTLGTPLNYVNIPDTNFGKFLIAQYPACLYKDANNKYWMDTTCGAVVGETIMDCSSKNIKNIEGVQYFKQLKKLSANLLPHLTWNVLPINLDTLYCAGDSLTTLYTLPQHLKIIACNDNLIDSLPNLPNSLIQLGCSNNKLTSLPALPQSLWYLGCKNNKITNMPVLPNSLKTIACEENKLNNLPSLPNTLTYLTCENNNIYCLPKLPDNLINFNADLGIKINCLPNIPSGVTTTLPICNNTNNTNNCPTNYVNIPDTSFGKFLIAQYPSCLYKDSATNKYWMDTTCSAVVNGIFMDCSHKNIVSISGIEYFKHLQILLCNNNEIMSITSFPKNYLGIINVSFNKLTTLPTIPADTVEFFNCSYNYLTNIPKLPSTLLDLNCSGNYNLSCLPKLPAKLDYLESDNTSISCIPNSFLGYNSNINPPICNPSNNPNNCQIYPSVSGKVFTDNNSNDTKDTLEFYRPLIAVGLNNGQTAYTNLNGYYNISIDTFGTYTVKATPPPFYKAVPDSFNITFGPNALSVVLPDIALQPLQAIDSYAVKIVNYNMPRPGRKYAYSVAYANAGTTTDANDNKVRISFPANLHFDSVSATVAGALTFTSSNEFDINVGKLLPGQFGNFNVYFTVDSNASIGDSVKTIAAIIYKLTKTFDINKQPVVNSFDPNDKQATPQLTMQQVQQGDYIDYIIRFQNTGTASAINIVIEDSLSSYLLANGQNSITILPASHNCAGYRTGNGKMYFEFYGINLPDSNKNEALSHGFVHFQMKAQPTLSLGTIIPNQAKIVFDYNKSVATNVATTEIKNVIVPVRILEYKVSYHNEKRETRNDWKVGGEINVLKYVVERSADGKEFTNVGTVTAKGLNEYQFTDNSLPFTVYGDLYYRIKIVDKDSKIYYSEIRKVETGIRNNKSEINLYPNPAKDKFTIETNDAKELVIIDALGKTIYRSTINRTSYIVNCTSLTKGVYLLKMIMNNGEVKTGKLVIE